MKKYIYLTVGFALTAFLAACGNNKSSSGGGNNSTVCSTGYVLVNGTCVANTTGNITSGVFYDFNYSASGYGTGNLLIRDAAAYKHFLKTAMGVCDRSSYNGGAANCDAWVNGYFQISLTTSNAANSNNVILQFRAWPTQQYWSGNFGFDTQGAVRNPLALSSTVSVINNYQGFQVDAYGDYYTSANRSLITLQVANGKLQDNSFNYKLIFSYNGANYTMAEGTMKRF